MSSFSNSPLYPRYYNPDSPIHRNSFQKSIIFLTQFCLTIVVYWATYRVAGGLGQAHEILRDPHSLITIPFQLWLSLIMYIFLIKIFHPIPTIIGGICVELLIQWDFNDQISWMLVIYLLFVGISQNLLRYEGGDYYRGKKFLKEILLSLLIILVFLPIFYYFAPFSSNLESLYSNQGYNLRAYYLLYILVNQILVFIIPAILLWIMDRSLIPYFPLTEQEKQMERSESEEKDDENIDTYLDALIPKPGELYTEALSHHSVLEDNHTIVLMLGKVRIYLCTRCTAMILGVIISGTLFWVLSEIWRWIIPSEYALWGVILLPIIPLTDWGLQAVHIRPATTTSRLITGFILGICLNMILYAQGYEKYILIAIVVYFGIFGVLYYLRSKEKLQNNT